MKTVLTVATTLAILAGTADAQAGDDPVSFSELDVNGDLLISPDEARANAKVAGQFMKLDSNGDGFLDAEEFSALDHNDENY